MRRATLVLTIAFVVGCGSGLEGTLAWTSDPSVSAHAVNGSVKNTTSHSVSVNAKTMRLLDADGRKVSARIRVGESRIPAHGTTTVRATWKSGKPVRIDYGTGTLALPSE